MRVDILIDDNDDLLIENTVNPAFVIAQYEGEMNGASLAGVALRLLEDINLDIDRTGDLQLESYVKLEEGFAGTNPILLYFYFVDSRGERTESPQLPLLDDKGRLVDKYLLLETDPHGYRINYLPNTGHTYQGYAGAFVASTYEQGDLVMDFSVLQNEKMLLVAEKGNFLEHPTRGVALGQQLNSNMDRDTMRDLITKEFEKDELVVTEFEIDRTSGFLTIKSLELYDTSNDTI